MKLVRKAVTRYVETYELELTDDYVASLNSHLQKYCTEELPLLTVEDIVNIVNYEDGFQKEYIWKWPYNEEGTFSQNLDGYVRDLINDDIWDLPYESDFIETESFETQAFRTEEEEEENRYWYL